MKIEGNPVFHMVMKELINEIISNTNAIANAGYNINNIGGNISSAMSSQGSPFEIKDTLMNISCSLDRIANVMERAEKAG